MSNQGRNDARSKEQFERAKRIIPGGVNSPVRAFRSVGMTPFFVDSGKGCYIYDIDGNAYIDYIGSWGPLILGHAHPKVLSAIVETAARGTSFGAPTQLETMMAELVCERMPSVEVVRMVNSGTEATMSALRLARGYTGRPKIVKFTGAYHGHADALLIKAGSGVATLGLPDSPGVLPGLAEHTITIPYNDQESLEVAFRKFGEQIAAVIIEPVSGNMGVVPPEPGYLQYVRNITKQYGSLLIFDEVMTGFRVHLHSAQGLYQVLPDLTCMGKVIGGGLPVGAYGGKREVMEQIAPSGPIYQAGTLSGNPLAMAAGLTTLQLLGEPGVYETLERRAARLEAGLNRNARDIGIPCTINRVGSMICPFFTDKPVKDYDSALTSDLGRFNRVFARLLDRGVSIAPSQFEGWFVSLAHSDQDIDRTVEAHYEALRLEHSGQTLC
jgi:glutamate-1-semialdehyde 2,1-aminomutase